jgi:hypothetical protein
MLVGSIVTGFVAFFLNSHYSGKMIGYTSWMQLKDIFPSFGLALIIALSVYFLKYLNFSYFIILPIQIIVGIMVFFIVCIITRMEEYREIKRMVAPMFQRMIGSLGN